jgi:hypothetical protein
MKDPTHSGADDADGRPEPDWEVVGNRLSKEMWEGYVGPELQRRQDAGDWPEAEPLYRWQVLLHDERSEVRINREVRGCMAARPRAGMIVEAGQELMVDDVDAISAGREREREAPCELLYDSGQLVRGGVRRLGRGRPPAGRSPEGRAGRRQRPGRRGGGGGGGGGEEEGSAPHPPPPPPPTLPPTPGGGSGGAATPPRRP